MHNGKGHTTTREKFIRRVSISKQKIQHKAHRSDKSQEKHKGHRTGCPFMILSIVFVRKGMSAKSALTNLTSSSISKSTNAPSSKRYVRSAMDASWREKKVSPRYDLESRPSRVPRVPIDRKTSTTKEHRRRQTKTGEVTRISRDHSCVTSKARSPRLCSLRTIPRVPLRSDRVRSACATPLQVYPISPRYYRGFVTRHHERPIPPLCSTCFLEESTLWTAK